MYSVSDSGFSARDRHRVKNLGHEVKLIYIDFPENLRVLTESDLL